MPPKNSVKLYLENGFYHLYNRGVDKRTIFQDNQDHKVFLHYLKFYLSPQPTLSEFLSTTALAGVTPTKFPAQTRIPESLYGKISLLAYCLMPNHFHLQVKQKEPYAIAKLILKVATNYSMYFNKKYKRVGHLFQGVYRAVLIDNDSQFLHLSRYIHLNPVPAVSAGVTPTKVNEYPYSSYLDYLGLRNTSWLNTQEILSFFKTAQSTKIHDYSSYQSFVEDYQKEENSPNLAGLTLEDPEEE